MKGRVTVRLKAGVLDVEGKAVAQALTRLGFGDANAVRVGKVFEVELGDGHHHVPLLISSYGCASYRGS